MNGRLVWRALLAGTGFNIAVSLLMSFGSTAVFNMVDPAQFALLSFALRIVSALADIGGGAIAGYIARDDGPIHGALTSLIATLAVTPVALLRLWQIKRAGGEYTLGAAYWIDFGLWTLVGLFLAAMAGFIAVELRKPRTH
ncbi:MAG TPA: hypothetical protein PLQ74_07645 [Pseudomonadota bacterium]|nr:hypothetical protein [Pseudomonadota bacterium]